MKYGDAAAIPDGSTVKITEYVKEPTDPEPSREPLETEAFVSKDYLANRTAVLGKCLGVPQDGRVFFSKFLNVSIVHNGQTVTPQAAVEVSVETTAVDIACADEVELARVVYDEEVARNAQAVKDGYVASDGKTVKAYPVYPATVVDSNGSGDVFHGAFAAAILKGYDYETCCHFSSATSAIKCMGVGARESVPSFDTVKQYLKENGYEL